MTDSYIAGNEPTKKLQTYKNTVAGEEVHSEAVTSTLSNGTPIDPRDQGSPNAGGALAWPVSVRGADNLNPASFSNPLSVSMPTMAAVTALSTPDSSWYSESAIVSGSVLPELVGSPWSGFGNALLFDGVNQGVSTKCVDAGNKVTGTPGVSGVGAAAAFTLEAKVRTGSNVATTQVIAGRLSDITVVGGSQPGIFLAGGVFSTFVRNNTASLVTLTGTTVAAANTKYDVAASYDGTTYRLFINGVIEASVALSGVEVSDATTRFLIGKCDTPTASSDGGLPFGGIVDEVRWSSVARYTANYAPATVPFSNDSNTLGLWHLDQEFGTIAVTAAALTAGTASIGKVVPEGSASGVGTTPYSNTALSNTKQAVKASSGRLYGYHIHNPNTATMCVQFFDVASGSVTVGTTVPTFVLTIPANATSPATLDCQMAIPISFGTAITIAATTTATGSTAPTTALVCSLFYI